MNARECLQALLDGKILRDEDYRYWRMNDEGELQTKWEEKDDWIRAGSVWNGECRIHEEYSLTFKDALKAMIGGKIVESEDSKHRYHLINAYGFPETFVQVGDETCTTILAEIKLPEQLGKWKVVE